ncbi:unnamed protein product [Arctia plantaginis]|uniref:RING-type domain-containing protein n=1 Tax=Arctia plantaginis TaxID=874455 RepID=A0A8S0ZXE6_ARCPL|nr:unnamed protein product [Arctia plantaginis]
MAASEPLRFHEFRGKDILLSRCHNRVSHQGDFLRYASLIMNGDPGSPGTEVVYSHRPIQVGETVPLHFGHYANISAKAKKPSSIVTLGFTENNPSTLTRVPRISQLGRLPGYWVSELPIYFGYRLQFCVDSLGEICFSDSQRTWTGPRVDRTNVSLWAVLSIPEHYFAEFDREAIPRRALSNAVPVSSPHRGVVPVREGQSSTHSIPSSSSRSARTLHQTETSSSSSKCIICCNKPTDTALSPCGHMYTCHDCALDLWQGKGRGSCPTCRKKITSVLRVYRD